ncbi:hypothetical protein EDB87DRAFT_1595855, partial [Lactarius vividus]
LFHFLYVVGAVRTALVVAIAALYGVTVSGACTLLIPIPPIHNAVMYVLTALLSRLPLLILGVCFDPLFVFPVSSTLVEQHGASPETRVAGRKTGTGSAATNSPTSLLRMITLAGNTPLDASGGNYSSLEEIRRKASCPLVVFPECTTSDGRGLLRFAEVFKNRTVPVKGHKLCVSGVYDPPAVLSPMLSHSIPSALNPLLYVFSLASTFRPLTISPLFMASEVVSGGVERDTLSAPCAGLISQLCKLKKMSLS